jgi:predicted nucleic acid-binding protein
VTVYIDSSVILRVVLGQANQLAEWRSIDAGVTSALAEVECLRTLDRLRLTTPSIDDESLALRRASIFRIVEALETVEVTSPVLRRAAQPMATALGTLDAIHLATAHLWRDLYKKPLTVATHDRALAVAAMADGFAVIGSA